MAEPRTQLIIWLIFCIILLAKATSFRRKSLIVLPVSEVRALASGARDVLVTWHHPGHPDASFIITWKGIDSLKGDNSKTKLKQDKVTAWLKGEKTDQNVKVLKGELRSVLLQNTTSGSGIQVCVTTLARKVLGQLFCSTLTTSLGQVLPAPLNLHWTEVGLPGLIWKTVNGAESYLLQWEEVDQGLDDMNEVPGHSYSSGFSFRFDSGLAPGFWRITVRAINGHRLGEAATYYKEVNGLTVQAMQIGKTDVRLRLRVIPREPKLNVTYDIIALQEQGYKVMVLDFECPSLETSCDTMINGVKFMTNKVLKVTVKGSSPAQLEAKTSINIITNPTKPSNLKLKVTKAQGATIIWDCFEPRVTFYAVAIFWNHSRDILRKKISMKPPCSLELTMDALDGNVVEIEACIDQLHCSSPSTIILKLNLEEKIVKNSLMNEKIGPNIVTVVIIAAILIFLTLVIIYIIEKYDDKNFSDTDNMTHDERKIFLYGVKWNKKS